MERDDESKPENRIAHEIVDAAVKVHRRLGAGMLESAYHVVLQHELQRRRLRVRSEVPIDIFYEELTILGAFRADLIVEDLVLVELKSVPQLIPAHKAQALTYLRFTGLKLALVLNFGAAVMRDGIRRVVNRL